ncbi:MAG: hypothetical protein FLDDKLPJ_01163 [Phycisphaerae bacterium]|nr:hypothetical protein [Phycisphaerae bacterium]
MLRKKSETLGPIPRLAAAVLAVFNATSAISHGAAARSQDSTPPSPAVGLAEARYACPMDAHPDETDSARQGAYFSLEPGDCPWCGMKLAVAEELTWVRARRAAGGGEVAFTCPDHLHVFSKSERDCPRCRRMLEPFRVMYTCPDAAHATVVRGAAGTCPHDGRALAAYKGPWLSDAMSSRNAPPPGSASRSDGWTCPEHPAVVSGRAGNCPVCAAELIEAAQAPPSGIIPPDAKFTCPMQECNHFAATDAERCPECGMKLKPLADVPWARGLAGRAPAPPAPSVGAAYVCPMHPTATAAEPATCPTCGMKLVRVAEIVAAGTPAAAMQTQVDFITEHYLELGRRFASDTTREVALHALGVAAASEDAMKLADASDAGYPVEFVNALRALHEAALKTTGQNLDADRVTFVTLSNAMTVVVGQVRPDRRRFPDLYVFHCPMTKGDWIQDHASLSNPFYGFKMLKCGEPRGRK